MRSQKTLFFPFSPGIPWKIKNGKYVVPELPVSCFMDVLQKHDAVVSVFGGFLESFYSLSILEAINRTSPATKLFWCGDDRYHHLLDVNGLAKPFDEISQSDLDRFPTPIFFDKNDRAYFNCLNNYLDVQTYYLKQGYRDRRPVIEQIVEKSTIGWDIRHMPQLRHFQKPPDIDHYLRMYRLHVNGPFVLLFPDGDNYSQHDVDCLGWELHHVRSAAAILQQRNIPLVLMTDNINRYAYSQAKILPLRIDFAIYLMKKASAILSKNIDFPLVSFAISDAKVVSVEHKHEYNLSKNLHFIDCNNDIYTKEVLSPIDVCNFITESKL
ncbi:MAG: hypothetical protein ACXADB_02435 [Candidatus Hermodarchaeia archaeon]